MNETFKALLIYLGLVVVTFCSGYLPNLLPNRKVLNLFAAVGGGILMGASLLVVLPESVKMLVDYHYEVSKPTKAADVFTQEMVFQIGMSVLGGFLFMLLLDELITYCQNKGHKHHHEESETSTSEKEALLTGERVDKHDHGGVTVTTVGLCAHSLAEGIAMGASQYSKL